MYSIIDEEIKQNHNQAEAFISLFFAGLDAVTYIVILTLFGCEFKSLGSPKQKLSIFLLLDGILRIINMYSDAYSKTFVQETVFTLVVSIQFYLSVSLLEQVFLDKSNDSYLNNELHIKNKFLFFFYIFLPGIFLQRAFDESYFIKSYSIHMYNHFNFGVLQIYRE